MFNRLIRIICVTGLCGCTTLSGKNTVQNGWCFSGGAIYTAAIEGAQQVSAVAVKDGRISYASPTKPEYDWCEKYAGQQAQHIQLGNRALYPGFTDGHAHLLGIGLRELLLNLDHVTSIKQLQVTLAKAAKRTPKGQIIYGRGWIETHWPEKRFPTRHDLDVVTTDHPVILERADGHAVIVNSLVLKQAAIDKTTQVPFGGDIRRFKNTPHQGEATGLLIDNAQALISDQLPKLDAKRRKQAYINGARIYAKRGWTNMHSMSVDPNDMSLITQLAADNKIPIRIYNAYDLPANMTIQDMQARFQHAPQHPHITHRAVKLYADGALGSRGAALLAPYTDEPSHSGLMTLTKDTILPILRDALKAGIQINTHAIGDKANRKVLDWYEQVFIQIPDKSRAIVHPRWRIEHAQILNPTDIARFQALDVLPSMQPSHAIGDLHFAVERLGVSRLKGGYAWHSLAETGRPIIGGSDAPVEVGDPLIEFYAAITRKDLQGYSTQGWYPEQKLTRAQALKALTIWPAYGAFQEDHLGSIEVGKMADFTLLSADIMKISPSQIPHTQIEFTMVDGQIIYQSSAEPDEL